MHKVKDNANIKIAFFLNLAFTVIELFGGMYVNSIAIISDALHDFGDSVSLGLAWYLQNLSRKKANSTFTFGYQRFSVLGALINGVVLLAGSGFIIYNSVERIMDPQPPVANGMLFLSILGIAFNFAGAFMLSKGSSLNEKVIHLHLLEDVLGWAAVLIVSIVLMFQPWYILDPLLSLGITIFILINVFKRLKESLVVFLQSSPQNIDIDKIEDDLLAIKEIESTHHIHSWSLDGEHHVLTAHIRLKPGIDIKTLCLVKAKIDEIVSKYHFEHTTIQTELAEENCPMDKSH